MKDMAKRTILPLMLLLMAYGSTATAGGPLTIGVIKKPLSDGCGCYLQLPQDSKLKNERYVFLADVDGSAQINVNGQDITLKQVTNNLPQESLKVGAKWSEVYESGKTKVEVEYVVKKVCDPNDEACEVTHYSATITVTHDKAVRKVNATGLCGC